MNDHVTLKIQEVIIALHFDRSRSPYLFDELAINPNISDNKLKYRIPDL